METFLGICLVAVAVAGLWRENNWRNEEREWILIFKDEEEISKRAVLQRDTSMRERDAVQANYDALIERLRIQALTATAPQPQNRRIRAGSWAQVRQANADANRNQAETEEAKERDTAFVE